MVGMTVVGYIAIFVFNIHIHLWGVMIMLVIGAIVSPKGKRLVAYILALVLGLLTFGVWWLVMLVFIALSGGV